MRLIRSTMYVVLALAMVAGSAKRLAGAAENDDFSCGRKNTTCLRYVSSTARLEVRLRVGEPQPDGDPAVDYFLQLDPIQGESKDNRHGERVVAFRGNVATTPEVATALLAGLAVLTGKITAAYARFRTGLDIELIRDTFATNQSLPDDVPTESFVLNFTALSFPYVRQGPGDKNPPSSKQVEELGLAAKQFGLPSPIPTCSEPLPLTCNLNLQYGVSFNGKVPMLTIRVTDSAGKPVTGALVDACVHGQLEPSGQAVTDASGVAVMPIPAAQAIDGVTVQTQDGGTLKTCNFGATVCSAAQPIG